MAEFAYQIMQHMGDRIRDLTESYMKAARTVDNVEVTFGTNVKRFPVSQRKLGIFLYNENHSLGAREKAFERSRNPLRR